ncbi:hypothetical protein CPJCM30710_14790 [Clostridium polyendosporum]|uniref:3D domain-containing protein n=1 Tax=Clostridium polyendosporum TaxID=69208 RepID=A0A919S043_9CLOT|nr:3D domain-containing protein [Clostridium polyendosporum]GIM28813.1 hypothetical protein CPJCM30710_14790 [Clostridium polyendosporum]
MNKKALFGILMLVLSITINCNAFAASSTEESTELKQTQDTKKDVQAKAQQLDKEIDAVLKKIDTNKKNMNAIARDIKNTQIKLEAAENDSKAHEELLNTRLRAVYKNDVNNTYIGMILSSNSLSDFVSRLNMITKVIEMDKDIIAKAKERKKAILKQKEELNYENAKLVSLKESNESILVKLNNDINEQKDLLDKITQKEKELIAAKKAKELAEAAEKEKQLTREKELAATAEKEKQLAREKELAATAEKEKQLAREKELAAAAEKEKMLASNDNNTTNNNSNNNTNSTSSIISRGTQNSISYSKVMQMEATAYSLDGITALGVPTKRDPNGYSTIAVDPRVIPLGSKVYVEGYGYAVANDTGSAIKGNIIDVYFPSQSEAINWGRRSVTVRILN